MGQHDMIIDNASGANVRQDINNALPALAGLSSGASEPATKYAYQLWADTTTGLLKIRNAANNAWIIVGTLASANLGLLPLSGGTLTGALSVPSGASGAQAPQVQEVALLASDNKLTGHQTIQGRINVASSVAGTVDAITAVHSPTFTAWVDKMRGTFRAAGTNATTTPTFAPDGLAAKTIVKEALAALAAGDIAGAGHEVEWIYNATADKVILLNPKSGGAAAASQTQMEAASDNTVMSTPGRQHYHPSAAKAWVEFNGNGTVSIRVNYGVSSITDNGVGSYIVNLTIAFSIADYCIVATSSAEYTVSGCWPLIHTVTAQTEAAPTASAFYILFHSGGAARDPQHVSIACFGDQ